MLRACIANGKGNVAAPLLRRCVKAPGLLAQELDLGIASFQPQVSKFCSFVRMALGKPEGPGTKRVMRGGR